MPHLSYEIKLHAGSLHHENAQMTVHEVFVHPFRLPRRGEEMAHFLFLLCFCIAKKSLFPEGNKDRKYNFCGTTLFAGKPTARPAPTRRLPSNAGNASEDTQAHALSLCPRRPICCPASRFPLSCGKLSVDALAALLPRLWFAVLKLFSLYTKSNCLSRTFFKKFSRTCGQMFFTDAQYSRTTPLTTPMIWA